MEQVTATLAGRHGSFALQHSGSMDKGAQSLSVTVIPDSATDGLAGLTGSMAIKIDGGQHSYTFHYTLPQQAGRVGRDELRAALSATVTRLIQRAAAERWPIRADHCFLRIAYDSAVGAKWDTLHAKPAWRSLPERDLAAALAIAGRIESDGLPALVELNAASLRWRGKRG